MSDPTSMALSGIDGEETNARAWLVPAGEMMARKRSLAPVRCFLAVVALGAASCGHAAEPLSPEPERRIGVIQGYQLGDPLIAMPESVSAGEPFFVEVATYGDGCYTKGETEVQPFTTGYTVTPYDQVDLRATGCARMLRIFQHRVSLSFPTKGTAVVRVVGLSHPTGEIVETTYPIVVTAP